MINNAQEFADALTKAFADVGKEKVFTVNHGRKYDKIVVDGGVYCFIDVAGNIYKAASWAAPAKGVRATLAQITPEVIAGIAASGYATTGWLYRY